MSKHGHCPNRFQVLHAITVIIKILKFASSCHIPPIWRDEVLEAHKSHFVSLTSVNDCSALRQSRNFLTVGFEQDMRE